MFITKKSLQKLIDHRVELLEADLRNRANTTAFSLDRRIDEYIVSQGEAADAARKEYQAYVARHEVHAKQVESYLKALNELVSALVGSSKKRAKNKHVF